ncbi:MAG: hypothetical protein O2967_17655 [Proteobacteria bacterium]|nr:hypothetical protein [Pseudomonadota bacterium]
MARSNHSLLCFALMLFLFVPETVAAVEEPSGIIIRCLNSSGVEHSETVNGEKLAACQVGDRVTVTIPDLEAWIAAAPGKPTLENLRLALDGQLLVGDPGRTIDRGLIFDVIRKQKNPSNMAVWKSLLARMELFKPQKMTIALGREGSIERYGQKDIWLIVASDFRLWIVGITYGAMLVVFFWLVLSKGLLRDLGPKPEGGKKPFSLGSTQMAFWFFIVLGGFLYVWLVAGDLSVLTPSVLGLIGISAATGLAATSVATSKQTAIPAELLKLEQEKTDLDSRLSQLDLQIQASPPPSNLAGLESERDQKKRRGVAVNAKINDLTRIPASAGFFQDILGNGREVALPRFQMMGWTLVLGIVFAHSVFTTLDMPEFDATLLGLMGMSSGTYVGFKFPGVTGK